MRDDETTARILLEVARQFSGALALDSLLPLVLERITELLDAERALFALLDGAGRVERAVVHNLEWAGPGHSLPISKSLIEQVRCTGRVVVASDTEQDPRFDTQSVRLHGLRFMVGVPLFIEGTVGGVIYVDNRMAHRDVNEEIELLEGLGGLVSTAVENARLYEVQRYRARLLAEQVHDFRTPLAVVMTNAQLLTEPGLVSETEAVQIAEDVVASAGRMAKWVDNILELSRVDSGVARPGAGSLWLQAAIPRHLRSMEVTARAMEVAIRYALPEGIAAVETIEERVWIVLDNLVYNALKHASCGTDITISARMRPDVGPAEARARPMSCAVSLFRRQAPLEAVEGAAFVEISIHNLGTVIEPDLLPSIFCAFVRGAPAGAGRSTGLGLSIVDQCVRHLGGLVWVTSTAEAGTTFTFSLPCQVVR